MRWIVARALSIADRLLSFALRFSPSIFLCTCSLQRSDDVDEACSLAVIHLALPCPTVRIGLGDHAFSFVQLGTMYIQEGDVRAEVGAVETRIRMRTWASNDRDRTVAIGERLCQHISGEPLQLAGIIDAFL